jgi:hypothetical protein
MMSDRQTVRMVFTVAIFAAATLVGAASAEARAKARHRKKGKGPGPCVVLEQDAARAQSAGHLREALGLLDQCSARRSCGSIRRRCRAEQATLATEIPSIVPTVSDAKGAPMSQVTVAMDGEPLAGQLDGRAIAVDPGLHEFTFKTEQGVVATQKVEIARGQRNRAIAVTMAPPALPPPPVVAAADAQPAAAPEPAAVPQVTDADEPRPSSPAPATRKSIAPYLIGGVGLIGVTGYGLFSYWGKKDDDVLTSSCSPNCDDGSVAHVRKMYDIGRASLAVGGAALGIAATWLIVRSIGSGSDERERAAKPRSYAIGVQPVRAGALASVSSRF